MSNKYTPIHAYVEIEKELKRKISSEPDKIILGTNLKELTDYYFSIHSITPLKIDSSKEEVGEVKHNFSIDDSLSAKRVFEETKDLSNIFHKVEELVVYIPIVPNPQIEKLKQFKPSHIPISWSNKGSIIIKSEIKKGTLSKQADIVANEVNSIKNQVYEWIDSLSILLQNLNQGLKQNIENLITQRRDQILADKERHMAIFQKINVSLKQRDNPALKRIQLNQNPLVQRIKPSPSFIEDYVLDHEKVIDVVRILDNYGQQFEKTPKSFENSAENDLRNVLLVGLNGIFEGKATGETFMANGKTDIYLNIDKGQILVCECKLWGGGQVYRETIDQILGYLTWRNNFGIILSFSRNKSFTKVLKESETVIRKHDTFKDNFKTVSQTHFVSNHILPLDDLKKVELHHLFYNLYI